MIKDIFGDRLTRIRNRLRLKSSIVEIRKNRITHALAQILIKDNLIQEIIESITMLDKKIPKPYLQNRYK
jgi:ribosomal protein S8